MHRAGDTEPRTEGAGQTQSEGHGHHAHRAKGTQTGQHTAAPHRANRAYREQAQGTQLYKSVHNCTFNCAKMIAWSTRGRPDRSS